MFTIARDTKRKSAQLFILFSLLLAPGFGCVCSKRAVDDPIEYEDGDYIVGAVFFIGDFVKTGPENQTFPDGYCSTDAYFSFWNLQRALAFKRTMREEIARFR